ncbi:MAG: hypothetical protein H5T82_02990 [Demequina sp.]|uniref:hypothetical protein n=1 Tax=Demequina sp. TaxID=2050685 RepID=UPI0019BD7D6A|nr:hypothetical protein [Demequina sp.]MBC7297840.1 hypothetical protein [Demequina sp.]
MDRDTHHPSAAADKVVHPPVDQPRETEAGGEHRRRPHDRHEAFPTIVDAVEEHRVAEHRDDSQDGQGCAHNDRT